MLSMKYNMDVAVAVVCFKCSAADEEKHLKKCPICFKYSCEECGFFFAGRHFCSKGCADFFFFGSGEEEDY